MVTRDLVGHFLALPLALSFVLQFMSNYQNVQLIAFKYQLHVDYRNRPSLENIYRDE